MHRGVEASENQAIPKIRWNAPITNFWYIEEKQEIMAKNTSISLGTHFEEFINREVASGRYSSVSEVIRAALRLLEREELKTKELRGALEEGEQSGFAESFSPSEFLDGLKRNSDE
ncbi:type II toxin-antitoxin system ParD family antitoxin [Pontibacter sp. G13]|uniref:type II toxin-antitoxin system ParD family antitoxin n=1 Tax=Pontibacter sp. G13 TaxID=3074898 RepID=UPI00288AC795|nr:type II toxin-antitoxin system ParD family antitoxin [Pontibacter sp. G13]WNJ17416.1 type II toxin-antitoxin system ParD family antitoxin [Pontibacter sp. G13]